MQALHLADWRFPSDGTFTGKFRDDFRDNRFLEAPCYLLLLKVMHDLTHDDKWASCTMPPLMKNPKVLSKQEVKFAQKASNTT